MYVCLIHTYTIIPLALSILQGGLGVKERAQGYPYFLGGGWWVGRWTCAHLGMTQTTVTVDKSVLLLCKGPHPSLPFLLPSSLLLSLFLPSSLSLLPPEFKPVYSSKLPHPHRLCKWVTSLCKWTCKSCTVLITGWSLPETLDCSHSCLDKSF